MELSRQLTRKNNSDRSPSDGWTLVRQGILQLERALQISPGWTLKTDTSCGGEIVSPILNGPEGVNQIFHICAMVHKIGLTMGKPLVDGECGLHLHFESGEFVSNTIAFSNLFVLMQKAEVLFYEIFKMRRFDYCGPIDLNIPQMYRARDMIDVRDAWYRKEYWRKPRRRRNRQPGAAPGEQVFGNFPINVNEEVVQQAVEAAEGRDNTYSPQFINSTTPGSKYDATRYHGLNLHCFFSIGTIEFRYAEGMFDPLRIAAWYELCLSIVNRAADQRRVVGDQFIMSKQYSFVATHYKAIGQGRFRALINELRRECKMSRLATRFILESVRKFNPHLLMKKTDNSVRIIENMAQLRQYHIVDKNAEVAWSAGDFHVMNYEEALKGQCIFIKITSVSSTGGGFCTVRFRPVNAIMDYEELNLPKQPNNNAKLSKFMRKNKNIENLINAIQAEPGAAAQLADMVQVINGGNNPVEEGIGLQPGVFNAQLGQGIQAAPPVVVQWQAQQPGQVIEPEPIDEWLEPMPAPFPEIDEPLPEDI